MTLTNHERRLLKVIDRYVTRYMRGVFAEGLRKSIKARVLMDAEKYPNFKYQPKGRAKQQLNEFLPWLNTLPQPLATFPSCPTAGLVTRAIISKGTSVTIEESARRVLAAMQRDSTAIAMECMLPLARRERRQKPKSLVQRRAFKAEAMAKKWAKRLAFAKVKLAKYQKKVAYYDKKGAYDA